MEKVYLDTYVFMDMLSGKEEFVEKAREHLKTNAVVSAIIFAELSYHVAKKDRDSVEEILYLVKSMPNLQLVPVSPEIAALAGGIRAKYRRRIEKKLTYFDCVHLATAISEKCSRFITGDRGLRDIEEINVEIY